MAPDVFDLGSGTSALLSDEERYLCSSMKITAIVTKSLHQDRDPCHAIYTYYFLIHTLSSSAGK